MSDDITDKLVVEDADGNEVPIGDVELIDISWTNDTGLDERALLNDGREISVSVDIEVPTEPCICPRCTTEAHIPAIHTHFYLEAFNCPTCGYPLR